MKIRKFSRNADSRQSCRVWLRKRSSACAPRLGLLIGLFFFGAMAHTATAQLPITRLDGIYPTGGMPGESLEVKIFGADLDDVDRLVFTHPGLQATRKIVDPGPFDEGPQPLENVFIVAIAGDVPIGNYDVRCQGKYGLSGARAFVVDKLKSTLEVEPNDKHKAATVLQAVPSIIDGQLNRAADVDWYQFDGKQGSRFLIRGHCRSIDSRADLTLTLTDASGKEILSSRNAINSDPLLDVVLPFTGSYCIKASDALYSGGGDCPYRISISDRPSIDFVFPPAGVPGSNEEYTVYGRNIPGGQPSNLTRLGRPLDQWKTRIAIPADAAEKLILSERLDPKCFSMDGFEYRIQSPGGNSNPFLMTVATNKPVSEQENGLATQAQLLVLPCEVAGQFYPQRDLDWYRIDAKAGQEYWIEVISNRLGLPTDPVLLVQRVEQDAEGKEQSTQVAWVDDVTKREGGPEFDERHHDPVYSLVAPKDGTYRLLIRDSYSSLVDDPALCYRLVVRESKPDFRLAAAPLDTSGTLFLRKGAREAIRVVAFRKEGYSGEIRVQATGLPPGVVATELILGPGATSGTLILSADANAPIGAGNLQIVGKGLVNNQEAVRIARVSQSLQTVPFSQPNNNGQASVSARMVSQLPVAVADKESARVTMKLDDPVTFETARGGVIKVKYSLSRQEGAGGNITGFVLGMPATPNPQQVNIGGNNSGEFEIRLQANTPPGTYTFFLAGSVQGMTYSRNPEATEVAKTRQTRINQLLMQSQEQLTAAQKNAQESATMLNQANVELTQATNAKTTAEQALAAATDLSKKSMESVSQAQTQLNAKPEDSGLKQTLLTAQTASDAAVKKAAEAVEVLKASVKKMEDAAAKQKTVMEAKTQADINAQAAQAKVQATQQEKQRTDQRVQQLQQQSNPRGFNLNLSSNPATIKIANYPIVFNGPPAKVQLKQGDKVDIPLNVQRLYGFDQNVNVQLVAPNGVSGVQGPNVSIAGNQTNGTMTINAQPNATPSESEWILRVTMNFNGQNLTLDHKMPMVIEKVEKTTP